MTTDTRSGPAVHLCLEGGMDVSVIEGQSRLLDKSPEVQKPRAREGTAAWRQWWGKGGECLVKVRGFSAGTEETSEFPKQSKGVIEIRPYPQSPTGGMVKQPVPGLFGLAGHTGQDGHMAPKPLPLSPGFSAPLAGRSSTKQGLGPRRRIARCSHWSQPL